MLCGNTLYYVKLNGEDLLRYSNNIESDGSIKCPSYHYLTKKVMSQQQTFIRVEFVPHHGGHRYGMKKLRP